MSDLEQQNFFSRNKFLLTICFEVILTILILSFIWFYKDKIQQVKIYGLSVPRIFNFSQDEVNSQRELKNLYITDNSPDKKIKTVVLVEIPKRINPEMSSANIKTLNENRGIFYQLKDPIQLPFWMNKMEQSIDLIWGRDNKIVDYRENLKPPFKNQPEDSLRRYVPTESYNQAFEVRAGFIKSNQIKIGDNIGF